METKQTQEAGQSTEEVRAIPPPPSVLPRIRDREEMEGSGAGDNIQAGHWIPRSQRRRLRRRAEARRRFLRHRHSLQTRGARSASGVLGVRAVNDASVLSSSSDSSVVDLNAPSSEEEEDNSVDQFQTLFSSSEEEDEEENGGSRYTANHQPILPFPPSISQSGSQ